MTDKDRLLRFINDLVPDNFVCGGFSLTFNDDSSAVISISNPNDDAEDADEDPPETRDVIAAGR